MRRARPLSLRVKAPRVKAALRVDGFYVYKRRARQG